MAHDIAVFETFLVVDGRPVEARGHLERFRKASGVDASEFLKTAAAKLSQYHQLRIDFKPGEGLGSGVRAIDRPSLFDGRFTGLKLASKTLGEDRLNVGFGPLKITDRRVLEKLETETKPALPLLLDSSGYILETSRHNVFIIQGGGLVTPPLDGRILPGITRQAVIEEAHKLGLTCREEPVTLDQAKAADDMFVTNAIIGIGWVEQCDTISWQEIPPPLITLHKALAARWQAQINH